MTQEYLLILKQFVTSLETVFVKFYQDFIVLLVVIQHPTHLVLDKLALLRKCVVSAKYLLQYVGKSYFSRQFYVQAKKMKPMSLQGNDSTKIKNTKTVPD